MSNKKEKKDNSIEIDYTVEGMHCSSCSLAVEKALKSFHEINDVRVDLPSKKVRVKASKIPDFEKLKKKISSIGYEIREEALSEESNLSKQVKKNMIFSWILIIPLLFLMLFSMFSMPDTSIARYLNLFEIALGSIVIFVFGWHTISSSIKALLMGTFTMDLLITIGSIFSFFTGILKIFGVIDDSFVMIGAMIIAINLTGNYIKEKMTDRANDSIKKLTELQVKSAHLLKDYREIDNFDSVYQELPISELKVGDYVLVKPGEKIPSDGLIIKGMTLVDQSIVTGESLPVEKGEKDQVIGTTLNLSSPIVVKITRIGGDTYLSQIIKLIEQARQSKVPIQEFADKVSSIFVPLILSISVLTFLIWYFFPLFANSIQATISGIFSFLNFPVNASKSRFVASLYAMIATLVIACPCAMGLATPTALMVGFGKAASRGILIKNAEAVEILKNVDFIVFDKTGTITKGKPSVTDFIEVDDNFIPYTYQIERHSNHPYAIAITDFIINNKKDMLHKNIEVYNLKNLTSIGFEGSIGSYKVQVVGYNRLKIYKSKNEEILKNLDQDIYEKISKWQNEGKTIVLTIMFKSIENDMEKSKTDITKDDDENSKEVNTGFKELKVLGIFALSDSLEENTAAVIAELKKMKYSTAILSGDFEKVVSAIAEKIGVDKYFSDIYADQKVEIIKKLQNDHAGVAMIGDGINDAPALKQADVGIAIGSGTDIAIDSADIVLTSKNPDNVLNLLLISKKIYAKIRQNLFWAFFYNILAIPLAMSGLLNPIIAELAMALSSINVVLNSLRLNRIKLR
ncbi:MAG: heavy metal translocating P-type ATPase [Spirochaetes bacterium]|nr:heavy metal translocating P-type ATPase [Spirochaetota bacterium]MBP8991127.1 heavy metal translocating P-type ATPase [Spirochaetota bacterium]HOV45686.1 heavy metal translocating P-type ATPase [Exilispira sp.]HQQ19921.1 heavy metal translocating P-type ATPase [Exilispira sp.]